jgi:O-antigen/teichoic acid export membrane protein
MTEPAHVDADATEVRRALAKGLAWSGALRWTAQLLSWAATLFLARLLTPRDYGLTGIAAVWSTWGTAIADFGISIAITSGRRLARDDLRQLHGLAICIGVCVALLLALAAGPIASLYHEPALHTILLVLAPVVVLDAARLVPVAALSRDLAFSSGAVVEFSRALTQTVAVLALAAMGYGYWALVVGLLLSSAFSAVLAIVRARLWPRIPRLLPDGVIGRARVLYAGYLAWQAYRGADTLIVGRIAGASTAGEFSLARTLAWLPTEKLVSVLTSLTQSFFAHLSDDVEETRRYVVWLTEAVVLLSMLPLVGLALTADLALPLALGPQWSTAAGPFRWLIIPTALGAATTILSQIAAVRGGERWIATANLASLALTVASYGVVGAKFGLTAALAAWAACSFAIFCWLARKAIASIGLPSLAYLRAWRSGVSAALVMTVSVLGVRALLPRDIRPAVELGAAILTGVVVALPTVWWSGSPVVRRIGDQLRRRLLRV